MVKVVLNHFCNRPGVEGKPGDVLDCSAADARYLLDRKGATRPGTASRPRPETATRPRPGDERERPPSREDVKQFLLSLSEDEREQFGAELFEEERAELAARVEVGDVDDEAADVLAAGSGDGGPAAAGPSFEEIGIVADIAELLRGGGYDGPADIDDDESLQDISGIGAAWETKIRKLVAKWRAEAVEA